MNTKLTLSLDKEVIERAKNYAKTNKTSLSRLIENYLNSLTKRDSKEDDESEITPFVKSITGVIPDVNYKELRKEYYEYLEKKHS